MPYSENSRESIGYQIRGTFRAFENALISYLGKSKVPVAHYHILRLSWTPDGISQTEISKSAFMSPSVTSQLIQKMGREGLVVRENESTDSRVKQVFLTKSGWQLRNKIIEGALEIPLRAAKSISDEDIDTMLKVLIEMRENLENNS